ncbi:MAG: hypothetical protein ACRD0L_00090 [Acidimicrobiales bacterium]
MDGHQAAEVLAEVDDLRRLTRRALRSFGYPMVVFGLLALAAAVVQAVLPAAVGWWWVAAGPGGGGLVWRHYRRRALVLGVFESQWHYMAAWPAVPAGIAIVVAVAPPDLRAALPWVVVGATYAVLGVLGWGSGIALVGLGLVGAAATSLAAPSPAVEVDLACGALLLAAGICLQVASRRPRVDRSWA